MLAPDAPPGLAGLLARLGRGDDPAAWEALVALAGGDMRRLARRLTGDDASADDAVQEALLRAGSAAARFTADDPAFADRLARRWLMRVTTHAALDLVRSRMRSRLRERVAGAGARIAPAPHEPLERAEQEALVREALAALPERVRTAIVLHHLGGLEFSAVAAELGVPVGTAKTLVARGLARLRTRLARHGAALALPLIGIEAGPATSTGPIGAGTDARHGGRTQRRASGRVRAARSPAPRVGAIGMAVGAAFVVLAVVRHRAPAQPSPPSAPLTIAARPTPAGPRRYEVGPGQAYAELDQVPWAALAGGDTVIVHARGEPYRAGVVITGRDDASAPITVRGQADGDGRLPVVSGERAVGGDPRGLFVIGAPDGTGPRVLISDLALRGARPDALRAAGDPWPVNAAAIAVRSSPAVVIERCALEDCANGVLADPGSGALTLRACRIAGNGVVGDLSQHNLASAGSETLIAGCRLEPLRPGALGNNLRDTSARCAISASWITGGNYEIDLADGGGTARVDGCVLVEPTAPPADNATLIHVAGGRSLECAHATLIGERSGWLTLVRVERGARCRLRDAIAWDAAGGGDDLTLAEGAGTCAASGLWVPAGFHPARGAAPAVDLDHLLTGDEPGFVAAAQRDWRLRGDSPCRGAGVALEAGGEDQRQPAGAVGDAPRPAGSARDLGALGGER